MKRFPFFVVGLVLIIGGFSSCQTNNIVGAVKKSHFQQALKITIDELIKRYQFIDASSVNWVAATDSNKNEYVEFSASINSDLGIVFNSLRDRQYSGVIDVSVVMNCWYEYFLDLVTPEHFKSGTIGFTWVRQFAFEPDYGDPSSPTFFNCNGGTLKINFTADKDGIAKIEKAVLLFDMQDLIDGNEEKYELEYDIPVEVAVNMFVNNIDIGYGTN